MEPARLGTSKRRPRRGSVERPVDGRLVRKASLVVIAPLALLLLTLGRSGPLPAPPLPPAFDRETATTLATDLARENPNRVPGSLGAADAATWFRTKLALYGLPVREDRWREDVPGVGRAELRNLAAVIQGTVPETIVFVAHRDNKGNTAGANDNASGTAALVELARAYATAGATESARMPLHTLVFLSTDGGAYGSLGAAHFAAHSPLARRTVAAVSLDGLAGNVRPRLEVSGLDGRSPPQALVRTASARVASETGEAPSLPGFLTQLVSLGLPFGYGEQAPILSAHVPAVRLTTASDGGVAPGGDELAELDSAQLGQLGRASETLLTSLDQTIELPTSTNGALYLGSRTVRGWALQLLLLACVVPFAAATLDLLSRARRRRLPLRGAWRALRRRVALWLLLLAIVGIAAVVGGLPHSPALPAPPDEPPLDSWPLGLLVILALVAFLVWLRSRARRLDRSPATAEQELAAYVVAFVSLLLVAAGTALVSPYSLVFVLPSLYAWLWLPQVGDAPGWVTDVLFGLGLAGPVLALVVLGEQLDLGARAPLYAASLLTTGVVPWGATLALAVWAAIAGLVGSVASGSYAPAEPSRSR
ncbi:MAG TPA: M28 family peptidase [Gaiella sp.]|nr:M28 family peptidase [Gaiella sp.]